MTPVAAVFLCLALFLAAWVVAAFMRSPYTPRESVFYFADVLLCRFLWRVELCDPFPVPPGQGAVIIANHRSSVDPFFVQLAPQRVVHWMVAKEFMDRPLLGFFLRTTGAIPTRRGGVDTAATKTAIRLAQEGELIGMFPEGRINLTDEFLLPVRPGAALVAVKARVPILPCYIEGAPFNGATWSPFFMPARVRVHFGQLIDLSAYYHRERESGAMAEAICLATKEIARLAGRPDYQPQLAGRRWLTPESEAAEPEPAEPAEPAEAAEADVAAPDEPTPDAR